MWIGKFKLDYSSNIKCSEFVKRQTPDSGYSHFNGSWYLLEKLVSYIINYFPQNIRRGYRDGVVLVDLPPYNFYSSVVEINNKTKLNINFAPRLMGEAPFLRISAKAKKQPAKFVSVVLYHADVLSEDSDRSSDADWEIIAIKARTSQEEEPMDPYTMARNFLHLKGGTKGDFTAQQFAESILYWNNHCMAQSKKSLWKKLTSIFNKGK